MEANYDPSKLSELQPGMTKDQVDALLGGPPNSVSTSPNGQTIEVWMHTEANVFMGSSSARSVGLLFDADERYVREINRTGTDVRMH